MRLICWNICLTIFSIMYHLMIIQSAINLIRYIQLLLKNKFQSYIKMSNQQYWTMMRNLFCVDLNLNCNKHTKKYWTSTSHHWEILMGNQTQLIQINSIMKIPFVNFLIKHNHQHKITKYHHNMIKINHNQVKNKYFIIKNYHHHNWLIETLFLLFNPLLYLILNNKSTYLPSLINQKTDKMAYIHKICH